MRRTPVVAWPKDTSPEALAAMLQRCLGFLHPLLVIPIVLSETGLATTPAGGGTVIVSSRHVIEWPDTGCDEWRLIGYGVDASSVGAEVAYQVNGLELCRASVPQGSATTMAGPWTRLGTRADLATLAGDQTGEVLGYGDGVGVVTWKHLAIQARTVTARG